MLPWSKNQEYGRTDSFLSASSLAARAPPDGSVPRGEAKARCTGRAPQRKPPLVKEEEAAAARAQAEAEAEAARVEAVCRSYLSNRARSSSTSPPWTGPGESSSS